MNEILNRYISELKNKILLKRINNKTEKQILFQTFKYFDKNTNGYCNFEDFIKVNEKIGVILSNPQELQDIFFYFDTNNEGMINYKDFINILFKPTEHNISQKNNNNKKDKDDSDYSNNKNYSQTNYYSSYNNNDQKENIIFNQNNNNKNLDRIPPYKKPFFDKIVNSLLKSEIGPSVSLLILHQGFILGDNNIMNQITIEEFIKIINDNHINLSISDIQMLFHSYELNNDGFFYYEEMFEDLINIYWNNQRKRISQRKSEEIINQLSQKGGLKINSLQNLIFVSKKYENFFYNQLNICDANEYYNELMKKYIGLKRILNCPRDSFLTLDDLEEIMKYISFGIENNVDFNKTINYIFKFDSNEKNKINNNFIDDTRENSFSINSQITKNKNNINRYQNQNNISNIYNNTNNNKSKSKTQSLDYYYIFREHFINYGIITLLNILKTFQYYDNGTKNINKNDFIKIMKDFQINISSNIIDQLYSNFNNNQNQDISLNYIIFISQLIDTFAHKNIIKLINDIYDDINAYCMNYSGKTMNLDFFKQFFNIHDNYFFNESKDALNNILIVYERFHYDFYEKYQDEINRKNKKDIYKLLNENIIHIEKNEFIWFYKFLNLFLENEIIFKKVILNDWKNILNSNNINNDIRQNNNFIVNTEKNNNINNNIKNINNINYIINNTINNLNEKLNNNISGNNNNNINNKKIIKQTPILMNKKAENINVIEVNNNSSNKQNKSLFNNTISNDINNNISKENHYEEQEKKGIDESNINNSQEPINNIQNTNIKLDEAINTKEEKSVQNDPLSKIMIKLKKRGTRGVMNLHKQFILSCKDLSSIPYEEFLKVMSLQRLSLSNDEYKNLFLSFTDDDNKNNLNFPNFIRAFKKVLNDKRLSAIENAFSKLDKNGNDSVPIDDIKMKFNAKENISVIKGEKDEEEILCEFLDCFDLNYNLLISKENQEDNDNVVNFEEFANFYEYVSFLYDNDDDFIQLINNSWKI